MNEIGKKCTGSSKRNTSEQALKEKESQLGDDMNILKITVTNTAGAMSV